MAAGACILLPVDVVAQGFIEQSSLQERVGL